MDGPGGDATANADIAIEVRRPHHVEPGVRIGRPDADVAV